METDIYKNDPSYCLFRTLLGLFLSIMLETCEMSLNVDCQAMPVNSFSGDRLTSMLTKTAFIQFFYLSFAPSHPRHNNSIY